MTFQIQDIYKIKEKERFFKVLVRQKLICVYAIQAFPSKYECLWFKLNHRHSCVDGNASMAYTHINFCLTETLKNLSTSLILCISWI